jgi:hypothetical protein
MDVAEAARGYQYVLRRCLFVAVDFGLITVQAWLSRGEIIGESFPYVPGGDAQILVGEETILLQNVASRNVNVK